MNDNNDTAPAKAAGNCGCCSCSPCTCADCKCCDCAEQDSGGCGCASA